MTLQLIQIPCNSFKTSSQIGYRMLTSTYLVSSIGFDFEFTYALLYTLGMLRNIQNPCSKTVCFCFLIVTLFFTKHVYSFQKSKFKFKLNR